MKAPKKNFIVDILAFVCFVFLVSTGIILYYNLPKGSGHDMTIWQLDRHEWGSIHFYIALLFLLILVLHLILHWRWIVSLTKGRRHSNSGNKVALGLVGLFALIAMALAPIISPVQNSQTNDYESIGDVTGSFGSKSIRGSMTLSDLEQATNIPVSHFIKALKLPVSISKKAPLKELRKSYGFTMEDVRKVVEVYNNE